MTGPQRKSAIVTGGSSGIGLACAEALARAGYDVALIARDAARLEAAAEAVRAAAGEAAVRVSWKSADLADAQAAARAATELADEGFTPDVLINSAGVIIPGEFLTMSASDFEANLTSGFFSTVHVCRAVAPRMVERRSGHIINVSSVAGFLGIYGYTGYAAAKYAVLGFSEALRFELKPHGVLVSVVCPPDTDTPGLAHERELRPPETEAIAGAIKPIPPERVARAVVCTIGRDRFHVFADPLSAVYFRVKGLIPELFFAIVDADVRRVRAGRPR